MDRTEYFSLVERVLTPPTAPFREHRVRAVLAAIARENGLDTGFDAAGNLYVSYAGTGPRVALLAHMDHPGFHVNAGGPGPVEARWHGGVAAPYFVGSTVEIWPAVPDGAPPAIGRITAVHADPAEPVPLAGVKPRFRRVHGATIEVDAPVSAGSFAVWAAGPLRIGERLVHARAIDDLAGCTAALAAVIDCARAKAPVHATAVLTRAEEVGFVGTIALVEAGVLPRDTVVIVIESSRALPGAEIGKGPVVRLGDRIGVFDFSVVQLMRECADGLVTATAGGGEPFVYQQKLMDGGTCEATWFVLAGYPTAGISIPLGNYHNMNFVDDDPAVRPEYVACDDLYNAGRLAAATAAGVGGRAAAVNKLKRRLADDAAQYNDLLLTTTADPA